MVHRLGRSVDEYVADQTNFEIAANWFFDQLTTEFPLFLGPCFILAQALNKLVPALVLSFFFIFLTPPKLSV